MYLKPQFTNSIINLATMEGEIGLSVDMREAKWHILEKLRRGPDRILGTYGSSDRAKEVMEEVCRALEDGKQLYRMPAE